jgi:MYXO-CTERM domain-containing protein
VSLWRAVGIAVVAMACLGSTCERRDHGEVIDLEVSGGAGGGDTVRSFATDEVSRISLDYRVRAGGDGGRYRLDAQVQTTGSPDAATCETLSGGIDRNVAALVGDAGGGLPDTSPPRLAAFGQRYRVSVEAGTPGQRAWVRFEPTGSGVSSVEITVAGPDTDTVVRTRDTVVEPAFERSLDESCGLTGTVRRYLIEAGTQHFVGFAADAAGTFDVVLSGTCEESRTVPATCPGAASAVTRAGTFTLGAGADVAGHIASSQLGIGDLVVVGLRCERDGGDCSGSAELVVGLEPLECRSTADCDSPLTCSSDGYCVGDAGCAAAPGGSGRWWWLALLAAPLLRRRRLPASAALLLALLLPGTAGAAPRGRADLYAEAGVGGRGFIGELAKVTWPGIRVWTRQGIQAGWVGGALTLETDYVLTDQPAPPYGSGLQTVTVGIGPRLHWELDRFEVLAGLDLNRVGVVANPLVRQMGSDRSFYGFAGLAQGRYLFGGGLFVSGSVEAAAFRDARAWRPSWAAGIGIGIH